MAKKEFIPFVENPQTWVKHDAAIPHFNKIIKKAASRNGGTIQLFKLEELHDGSPEIMVSEKDGEVSEITFSCPCGCKATVVLETEE